MLIQCFFKLLWSNWQLQRVVVMITLGIGLILISAYCVMKVDLMKAYDSVRWDFVDVALTKIGFLKAFIDWIMVCVISCQTSC